MVERALTPGRALLLGSVDEHTFEQQVITWAKREGWLVTAMHDSRQLWWGVDRGFPDLLLVRGQRIIAAELKDKRGRLTKEQKVWLKALEAAGIPTFVWRPTDEAEVKFVLGDGVK